MTTLDPVDDIQIVDVGLRSLHILESRSIDKTNTLDTINIETPLESTHIPMVREILNCDMCIEHGQVSI